MNLTSRARKERGESVGFLFLAFSPALLIPAIIIAAAISIPAGYEEEAVDVATSAVELLEADEDDFTYSRLAAEALSQERDGNSPDTIVTVTAAPGSTPSPGAYCVTVEVGGVVTNYDSSTEEYTQTEADEEFVCETTPEGWN